MHTWGKWARILVGIQIALLSPQRLQIIPNLKYLFSLLECNLQNEILTSCICGIELPWEPPTANGKVEQIGEGWRSSRNVEWTWPIATIKYWYFSRFRVHIPAILWCLWRRTIDNAKGSFLQQICRLSPDLNDIHPRPKIKIGHTSSWGDKSQVSAMHYELILVEASPRRLFRASVSLFWAGIVQLLTRSKIMNMKLLHGS